MWRFSIFLAPPKAGWLSRLLDRARLDPKIILEEGDDTVWLTFCDDEEVARTERWRMGQGGAMSATFCTLGCRDDRIFVNREGSSDSAAVMAPFGHWLLREMPVIKVIDDENGIEITDFAIRTPDAMFGALPDQ